MHISFNRDLYKTVKSTLCNMECHNATANVGHDSDVSIEDSLSD